MEDKRAHPTVPVLLIAHAAYAERQGGPGRTLFPRVAHQFLIQYHSFNFFKGQVSTAIPVLSSTPL